jgi:hypothetical protein
MSSSDEIQPSTSVHEGNSYQERDIEGINAETSFQNASSVIEKKAVMATDLERVQKVIHRFKEVIIELSSLVTADVRSFRQEEFQTLSEQMCIALNQLLHMIECTDEVFTGDDFFIVARQMKKQHDVRAKVLVILLRGHRVLLESILFILSRLAS